MSATTVKEDFMRIVQSILAAMGVRDPDEQDVSISVIVTVAVITVRVREVRQNPLERIDSKGPRVYPSCAGGSCRV